LPVTMSCASVRVCGVPTSLNSDSGFGVAETGWVLLLAAASASEP